MLFVTLQSHTAAEDYGETLSALCYEGPHTPALVRSDLLEEYINIKDKQMHLASSNEDGPR